MLEIEAVRYAPLAGGVTLAYEEFGERGAVPLLLVAGLGSQMIAWHDPLCESLASRGLRVIRFDNRDAGLSTHMEGDYELRDMAADAAGLLDHLGIESAHVAGVSMGGMIAQELAYGHPERVRSLISVSSTPGERAVSEPTPAAYEALTRPRPRTPEEAEEHAVERARVIGSPGRVDEDRVRMLARTAFARAQDPDAYRRQLDAIYAARDRTERVRTIGAPTLVIHGALDPLIPPAAGHATAAAIAGAELLVIDEMGHDMPPPLWPRLADAIAAHVRRSEA